MNSMNIVQLLAKMNLTISMIQGRRAVLMGAVKINDVPVESIETEIHPKVGDVVSIGKSNYVIKDYDLN